MNETSQKQDGMNLMTPAEIARALRVGTRTIRRMTKAGLLPYVRVGGCRPRYVLAEVVAALREPGQTAS